MTDQYLGRYPFDLADALDKIAEGYAAAAMVLRIGAESEMGTAQQAGFIPTRPQDALSDTQAPSFEDLPFSEDYGPGEEPGPFGPRVEPMPANPAGSGAVCPAHNIPYRKGRYGMYCPSTSDDPKWSNDKGYCTVTPKSAAAWLRQHA